MCIGVCVLCTVNCVCLFVCLCVCVKAGSQYTLEQAQRNLPALRCDRKCIQNDLDVRHNVRVRWNRNYFYSSIRDVRPNYFVCTSGRNARSSVYCEPAFRCAVLLLLLDMLFVQYI